MIELFLLLILGLLVAFAIVGFAFLVRYRYLFGLLSSLSLIGKSTRAAYGAEGGVISAAKRGSKNFLSELVKGVLSGATGGLSELAGESFPIIDEWLEKNPYAVIYAVSMIQKIPAIQNFLSNLTDGFDLSNLQIPAPQAPENTRVLEQYAKEEKAWWQA